MRTCAKLQWRGAAGAPVLLLMLCLSAANVLFAQETRGTILGRVLDPSGGVIPGVTVVVTNAETNVRNQTVTNDRGLFEIPLLMPGPYHVVAEQPGFKKHVREGITVSVNARVNIDIVLEIGGTQETVTVTAETPLLETATASAGQVMDNKRVMELPVMGNSVMLMAGLNPGMQRGSYNYLGLHSTVGASDYNTAGGVGGNEWSIDGTPNSGHSRRNAILPYTDTIEEFRVESASFDARLGHTTGASITMQTKSGTNSYHGSATWSHWQQRWNATPNNDNGVYWKRIKDAEAAGNSALADQLRSQPRQPTGRSNNYAASAGGPVRIPWLFNGKDRLFFFFSFNGFKDNKTEEAGNKLFSVPTVKERAGDFSEKLTVDPVRYQIYDPLSVRFNSATGIYERDPFPGNIIPSTRFLNPMYKFYEKLYPLPNNPPQMNVDGGNNYFNGAIPFNWNYKAFMNRFDWIATTRDRFFVRWSYNKFVEDRNDWTYETARWLHSNALNRIGKSGNVDWVHTFNPRTILNAAVAVNRYVDNDLRTEMLKYKPSDVGLPTYLDQKAADLHALPILNFSNNYRQVSSGVTIPRPITTQTLKADLSKYMGKHSLAIGWDGRVYYRTGGSPGNTSAYFNFNNNLLRKTSATSGTGTLGLEWAAFLMGIPNSMSIDTNDSRLLSTPYSAWYVQDNWRISSKLMLTLGLRLEYEGNIKERFNRGLRDFDPNADVAIAAAAQAAYAASPLAERPASDFIIKGGFHFLGQGVPRTRGEPNFNTMPRAGLVYRLNDRTVIRGGWGMFFDTLNPGWIELQQNGYSQGTSTIITTDNGLTWGTGDPRKGISVLADPFPVRPTANNSRFDVPYGNSLGVDFMLGSGTSWLYLDYQPARQHRWRFEIQRQLGKNMVVTVSHTGSYSDHLGVDVNKRPLPAKYWATGNARNDAVANDMQRNVTNPFYIGNFASLQTSNPKLYQLLNTRSFFTSRTIQKHQLLRPFPHMTSLTEGQSPIGKNWYSDVEAQFEKRFSAGWTLNTHLTITKTMEKNFFNNEFDTEPDQRVSNNSRPYRWVATGIYELPFGKGKPMLSDSFFGRILGGWQIGAIWQIQAGGALDWGNLFFLGKDLRDIVLDPKDRTKDRWFNNGWDYPTGDPRNAGVTNRLFVTSSAQSPASYHARVFPTRLSWVRASRLVQLDANLQKAFAIREGIKALFRADLLNAPNHQVLGGPDMSPTSSGFGKITGYVNTPRMIQFQMRILY